METSDQSIADTRDGAILLTISPVAAKKNEIKNKIDNSITEVMDRTTVQKSTNTQSCMPMSNERLLSCNR